MSKREKEEIILDAEVDHVSSAADAPEPSKGISYVVKFLLFCFAVLLIYHLVNGWLTDKKISELQDRVTGLNQSINDLKLENQKLTMKSEKLLDELTKTRTNLEFIDGDRLKKSNEIVELQNIVNSFQKNLPDADKLILQRLEKKLQSWEEYYKALNSTLKNRPEK